MLVQPCICLSPFPWGSLVEFQWSLITQGKQHQDLVLSPGQGRDKGMAIAMGQVGKGGQRQAGPCEYPIPQLGWKERGQGLVDLGVCVEHSH